MSTEPILSTKSVPEYFRELLSSAIERQKVQVEAVTEFYLVNLLSEFLQSERLFVRHEDGSLDTEPLAFMLDRALSAGREARIRTLKKMGDVCLYVSGFFSDSLNHKLVDVDYYISMGGTAYGSLAQLLRDAPQGATFGGLYGELQQKFTSIVDLFSEISERASVSTNAGILRLYERWMKTGSQRTSQLLAERGVIPHGPAKGFVQ